jgi:hypothetical protein
VRSVHVYAEVELNEVLSNFKTDEVLGLLRMRDGRDYTLIEAINVREAIPRLLEDLAMTQVKAETAKKWDEANALLELRHAVEAAFTTYRGSRS